jgi:glutamate formiminotransferase
LTNSTLLTVPNVSEGRDRARIRALERAFAGAPGVRLLNVHSDPDHHRSVFTLAGAPGTLAGAVVSGASEAMAGIDLSGHAGAHPRIGALDIAPVVYLRAEDVGAACAEALVLGDRLGQELELPVFLYGALGAGRTRADVRRGGLSELARRMAGGELAPDFGPGELHPTAGAVLVGARPPLVAFNVELAPPATIEDARAIAAAIREGGPSEIPGLRALGLWLGERGVAQVSMNVEDHRAAPLSTIVAAIRRHARPERAELVGLAPRAALEDFPEDVPLEGAATIEDALAAARGEPGISSD